MAKVTDTTDKAKIREGVRYGTAADLLGVIPSERPDWLLSAWLSYKAGRSGVGWNSTSM